MRWNTGSMGTTQREKVQGENWANEELTTLKYAFAWTNTAGNRWWSKSAACYALDAKAGRGAERPGQEQRKGDKHA